MKFQRGDVVLAFYPFASAASDSRRPVLIIQGDFVGDIEQSVVELFLILHERGYKLRHIMTKAGRNLVAYFAQFINNSVRHRIHDRLRVTLDCSIERGVCERRPSLAADVE